MTVRPPILTSFLEALYEVLAPRLSGEAAALAARVEAKLAQPAVGAELAPVSPPVCAHLEPALAAAEKADPGLASLVNAVRALAPALTWRPRSTGSGASVDFAANHANAMIAGPAGFEGRRDLWLGLSLLAPGTRYPDHDHAPPEVYLVLSPGEFRQAEGEWFAPGTGGTFYNPPGILHAMRAKLDAPLLAFWLLDVPRAG
jgi:hypothetical protein